jgi:hypothetical protein
MDNKLSSLCGVSRREEYLPLDKITLVDMGHPNRVGNPPAKILSPIMGREAFAHTETATRQDNAYPSFLLGDICEAINFSELQMILNQTNYFIALLSQDGYRTAYSVDH